ncbi:MAG TPA: anti-sigma factor, partial [Ferruginibacter sp.]|nr:anti-sigma factor [Ferruginibacter sp.]
MSNELKKFIRDNREAFDDKEPSATLWGRIESNLVAGPEKRSIIRPLYKWAMGAAAMLVIAASVYFFVVN